MAETLAAPFDATNYQIQHQLGLLKEKFAVTDSTGRVVMWATTPSFALKKEFHVYSDEAAATEVLDIKIHKLVELADVWDVTEPSSGTALGTIKYEMLKSMMTPSWQVLDPAGQMVAEVTEDLVDKIGHSLAGGLVPRKFNAAAGGKVVASYDQAFMSLMLHFSMDFSAETANLLDRRLGVAVGIVVAHKALIENQQGNSGGNLTSISL